jgi:hypothetical protein
MGMAIGHWYESPLTGLAVTILLAIGTTAIGWWNIRPKRLILVDVPQTGTPLCIEGPHSWPDAIRDPERGDLESLYIVKVDLRTKGRWDIASTSFDRGLPLILDVGVPILAMKILQAKGTPHLNVEVAGTELSIGPGLVRRRREWIFTLLTNEAATRFVCVNPLIDVDIRTAAEQRRRRQVTLAITLPLYLFILFALGQLGILPKIVAAIGAFFGSL